MKLNEAEFAVVVRPEFKVKTGPLSAGTPWHPLSLAQMIRSKGTLSPSRQGPNRQKSPVFVVPSTGEHPPIPQMAAPQNWGTGGQDPVPLKPSNPQLMAVPMLLPPTVRRLSPAWRERPSQAFLTQHAKMADNRLGLPKSPPIFYPKRCAGILRSVVS